jgi:hypothetical protein
MIGHTGKKTQQRYVIGRGNCVDNVNMETHTRVGAINISLPPGYALVHLSLI